MLEFTLNSVTYRYNPETNRYSKVENGKTHRIGVAEYEAAQHEAEYMAAQHETEEEFTPDQIEEMVKETEESVETEEAEKIIQAQKGAPKARKTSRKKTRIGGMEFDENGVHVVLTAKQVDFIRHLPDTGFWDDGVNSSLWVDCLCDDIGGQFENKPMTVGAMVSTLREKGLLEVGVAARDKRKCRYFCMTEVGKHVAAQILG